MSTLRRLKDVVALEQFGMVLTKSGSQPEIAQLLEKIGYSPAILAQGVEFLKTARQKYKENVDIKDRYTYVQADLVQKKREIDRVYRVHRRKVRLICITDPGLERRLAIGGRYPNKYPLWVETVRKFYSLAAEDRNVQKKLQGIGLTAEEMKKCLADITQLETLVAEKMKLLGELRLSTAKKNQAFKDLHKWMRIFFAAARLALKEEPTLLAALERHIG